MGGIEQDALLAVGVIPIATTKGFGRYPGKIGPWAQDELGDAPVPEVLDAADGVPYERVAALRPDLILGVYSALTEQDYATLSRIAPTVAQPIEYVDYGVPWQELTRTFGQSVGRADQADQAVSEVEALFAAARAQHPEFAGATALVVTPTAEGFFAFSSQDGRGRFLTALGFDAPEEIEELAGDAFFATISAERVDLLNTDVLIWTIDTEGMDKINADPLYNRLEVKTQGRDIFLLSEAVEDLLMATVYQTVLNLPFLLDRLVPMLAAAIDGDPATEVPG